jgi:hypothetical protein
MHITKNAIEISSARRKEVIRCKVLSAFGESLRVIEEVSDDGLF